MAKSSDAFRTIGEVSDELDVPKHVLRFWEGKFPQLKPMKRGGGRRFYRPEDVALLRGIHHLLHAAGYTIKGVQRILREQGVDAVKFAESGGAAPAAAPAVTTGTSPTQKKASKRAAAKRPPLPPALRSELEALASELDALLALARGEGARALTAARSSGTAKAKRG
jgi:DNA-binding transcriptional MerR regulator